jgi:large subunit ribosomal protein L16
LEAGWLTASQIEASRRVIIRQIRKIGLIWIRIFPYKPISQKPTKTRMGKGKGSVQYWVCPVSPGRILFEIKGGIPKNVAKEVLKKASQKLPIATTITTYKSSSFGGLGVCVPRG